MTIRVLLVDDERLIRAGLAAIINAEPDLTVVGEAADGADVPAEVKRVEPDVILMDVRMPKLDGIQATRRIMEGPEPPRVIVVTTFENDEYVYDALKAGASGFLLKRTRPEEILQAIRMVAHGDTLLFPAAIRSLAAAHGGAGGSGGGGARWHAQLTEREADVLRLMAKGHSNAEIAAELFVSPQTVKTHVGNVLGKLHARDRTQAVIFAYETGFITPG
ncbi:response regulator [Spirillospora sp. NPDC048911]|uniref:response regulator n=1 Tax=Spirillospora sp. NPDC048911 TaxID=3364527 RepID=UPI00371579CF